ncbi:MAG TPA: DUF2784 domain-containing protein [Gemmatimonadales bacterium]|jgi:hypothetical protein
MSDVNYGRLAELVVVLHFCFVLFVLFGGALALRWPKMVWVHLPAAAWGALISFAGWVCPLTPLEKWLRRQGGAAGYEGGFIEHYILPVLYPRGLTHEVQIALGVIVILLNVLIYRHVYRQFRRRNPVPG